MVVNKIVEKDKSPKQKLSLEAKKNLVKHLKRCAKYYKENLLGNKYLVLFNNGEYIQILFKKSDFKHLTGVSSIYNADKFYERCIGKGKVFISPTEIFTTEKHPEDLALKKLEVFDKLLYIFTKQAYLLKDIKTDTISYSFGVADLELTLLCDKYNQNVDYQTASSLRRKSYLTLAKDHYEIDYVFKKTNTYFKYSELMFPNKIDNDYFESNKEILESIIDYNSLINND